jgi:hypothetical protein
MGNSFNGRTVALQAINKSSILLFSTQLVSKYTISISREIDYKCEFESRPTGSVNAEGL